MLPYASTLAILAGSAERSLPPEIFGLEPAHGWCYFYEKADLARQTGEWQQVISLYQEAYAQGLAPKNSAERLPLVEAHLRRGEWADAYAETATAAQKKTWFNDDAFCRIWRTLPDRAGNSGVLTNDGYHQELEKVNQLLACNGG